MKRATWVLLGIVAILLAAILFWERKQPTTAEQESSKGKLLERDLAKATSLGRTGEAPVKLSKAGEARWVLTAPLKDDADRNAVDGFLERLAQMKAVRFPAAGTPLHDMGLDKPRGTWTVTVEGGPMVIEAGSKAGFDEGLYVRVAGKIALVPADMESLLLGPADDFRLKNLTSAATQEVQSFALDARDGKKLAFHRSGKDAGWQVTAPYDDWGAPEKIEQVLDDVSLCLVDSFAGPSLDRKAAGLEPPERKILITMDKKAPVNILLGGPVPNTDASKALIYAEVEGRPTAMAVSGNGLKSLAQDAEAYRSLKLFRHDLFGAQEMSVSGPVNMTVRRDKEGAWKVDGAPKEKGLSDLGAVPVALLDLAGEKAVPWAGPQMPGFSPPEYTFTLKGDGFEERVAVGSEKEGLRLAHCEGRPVALVLAKDRWKILETALKVASETKKGRAQEAKAAKP